MLLSKMKLQKKWQRSHNKAREQTGRTPVRGLLGAHEKGFSSIQANKSWRHDPCVLFPLSDSKMASLPSDPDLILQQPQFGKGRSGVGPGQFPESKTRIPILKTRTDRKDSIPRPSELHKDPQEIRLAKRNVHAPRGLLGISEDVSSCRKRRTSTADPLCRPQLL